jgi:2-dehydro-3-deoxyphosphogluconate aldolase/(4S)-4-hydroxy-2-oxoglutarate aldolase
MSTVVAALRTDRVLAVVRGQRIADAADLCAALVAGGIRTIELTFTIPDAVRHVRRAAEASEATGALLGVGTVMTGEQARAAADAGARFLVTPAIGPAVADVAVERGLPVFFGAFTPTEVAQAMDLGAPAVKIFPAGVLGPRYLKDLHGPFPEVDLLPSGGIDEKNAAAFLSAGALAVCAGTSVVPPSAVAAGAWNEITDRAARFVSALS